ncbi:hypothetical protein PSEUDO8O_30374 [Pseudomonas sp. 8O]|nr:hypothetical protein PSEUDO8O_30374 [Pseudomonas sp. 8O]
MAHGSHQLFEMIEPYLTPATQDFLYTRVSSSNQTH